MVNRAAIIVKPGQPYIDWANRLDDGPRLVCEKIREFTIYLIEDVADCVRDVDTFVEPHFE